MSALDKSAAHRQCGHYDAFEPEALHAREHANHVNNRIHTADFVQMNRVDRLAVDACFYFANPGKHSQRALLHLFGYAGFFHDRSDVTQVALGGVVMGVHVDLGGAEAVFGNLGNVQVEVGQVEFGQLRFKGGGRQAGVDECAEQHVAAGSTDAVEIGDFHEREAVGFKMRWAAKAAPKPLSMFTTVRPEAQELSMPSKAARPSNAAP